MALWVSGKKKKTFKIGTGTTGYLRKKEIDLLTFHSKEKSVPGALKLKCERKFNSQVLLREVVFKYDKKSKITDRNIAVCTSLKLSTFDYEEKLEKE